MSGWKMRLLAVPLVLMLSLSLMPNAASNAVWKSAGANSNPSGLGRVLIGYTGYPGGSYALLAYDYDQNRFYICWELKDNGLVANCVNEGGSASYHVWLRITDYDGTEIVNQKWNGWQHYSTYGYWKALEPSQSADQIDWPLTWELTCIAAGTNKGDFWHRVDNIVDKVGTVLTIIAIASIIAGAVISVYLSGGSTTPLASVIAKEAVVALLCISFELFKAHLMDQLEDEIIDWLDAHHNVGDENFWSTILLGVVNNNVTMESEATIELVDPPTNVDDTWDTDENANGPYEVRQYVVKCRVKRFNYVNLAFSTPEEVQDTKHVTHPGSKIASFCSTGVNSSLYGHFEKDDHYLEYRWDAGLECGYYPSFCLKYFWHDEYGNPYWDFGFVVDVDPEHADGLLGDQIIVQKYLAEIEVFGIDYYASGSVLQASTEVSVNIKFDSDHLGFYFIYTTLNITEPGQYLLVIPLQDRHIFIPIIAYDYDESFPHYFSVNIPDLPDQEEEVIVVVPKMYRENSPIILRNGLSPTDNIIVMQTPHLFFEQYNCPTSIYIDLNLLGEPHRILIETPNPVMSEYEQLSIEFPDPEKYAVIVPEMPIPPEGLVLRATNPDNGIFITPQIGGLSDLTIGMPYPAKSTYIWILHGNEVKVKLLKRRMRGGLYFTGETSLGLYTEVRLNTTYIEMYAGETGSEPFAMALLSKPEGEPSDVILVDTKAENYYDLYVTSYPSLPSVSLYGTQPEALYTVELTAYMNPPPLPAKTSTVHFSAPQTFSSGRTEFYDYNVYLDPGGSIIVNNNAKLIFNNTNIIGSPGSAIQAENNAGVLLCNGSSAHTYIDCYNSAELCASLSYVSEANCHGNSRLTACLGSRILSTNLLDQSLGHAISGPDLWYIRLEENSNFMVHDTTYIREVTIEGGSPLILAENSTLYGTHVSGTEPHNWALTQPETQVVWGPHSRIIREHRLFAGPDSYVRFYDETNELVLSTMTSALGDASVNIVYSEENCTSALRGGCATFNIVSKGPFKMTKLMGDVDKNEVVDVHDLSQVGKAFGSSEGDPRYDLEADLNCDDHIDTRDIMIVSKHWGYNYGI